ncbi:MAG: hypothetical protein NTW51_03040 [Cyanobacteria bacterium]|nr:hypothetical protein [Cyanobacteriota bacterium]
MTPSLLATLLLNLAFALFALFLGGLFIDILPPALLDSGWIVASITSLASLVPLPLLGLMLVHLAAYFSPTGRLKSIQLNLSRAAAVVAVGFFLLLPLMGFLVVKNAQTIAGNNAGAKSQITRKSEQLRAAVRNAKSPAELQASMQTLQGPGGFDAIVLARPLPLLKEQLNLIINRTERSSLEQLQGPFSTQNFPVLKALLRTAVQCLFAGLGFAGLAWSPVTNKIMLQSLLLRYSSFKSDSPLKVVVKKIRNLQQELQSRSNKASVRESFKQIKDSQRKVFLQREKEAKRNEIEMRKQRERLKRQAEQNAKRKD